MPSYEKVIADQACRIEDLKTEIEQLRKDYVRCREFLEIAHERCARLENALDNPPAVG